MNTKRDSITITVKNGKLKVLEQKNNYNTISITDAITEMKALEDNINLLLKSFTEKTGLSAKINEKVGLTNRVEVEDDIFYYRQIFITTQLSR